MPSLVKPWVVRYVGPDGKRAKKGAAGAKKRRERSRLWYGQGLPNPPPKKRVPLAANKEAARRMLDDLVRKAERGGAGVPDRDAGRKPLAEFVAAFESDVALGLGAKGKRRRAPSPEQVKLVVQRVRDLLAGCDFKYPSDLDAGAGAKAARYLAGRRAIARKDGGISAQTAEFVVSAARRFARWVSGRNVGVAAEVFDALPSFDPKNDRVHARREVSPAELARILTAARDSARDHRGLLGPDRYHLYLVAFATGYRSGELAELLPESFRLDADPPAVALPGRLTKNKKHARQPLPPAVAAQMREYLKDKPAGEPVWPGTWSEKPAKMLRIDLAAAGVPYALETPHGKLFADFHALRHTYVSALAAAGVGVKELQELARHSDPRLTIGVYGHTPPEALGAAVNRLQLPGPGAANPLAGLTREQLETAVVAVAGLLAAQSGWQVQPRVQPGQN